MAVQEPVFRQAGGQASRSGSGAYSVALPTRLQVNDLTIMGAYAEGGTVAITTDGGGAWTAFSGSPFSPGGTKKLYLWWRIQASSDTAPTLTASSSPASGTNIAAILAFEAGSFDTTTPIDAIGTATETAGATMAGNAVTTVTNRALAVSFVGWQNDGAISGETFGGSSTGVVEILDDGTTQGNDGQVSAATLRMPTAGSTGATAATSAAASASVTVTFGIRPKGTRAAAYLAGRAAAKQGTGAGTTLVLTLTQNVDVGDRLIVAAGSPSQNATVADSQSNSWTEHIDQVVASTSDRSIYLASTIVSNALSVGDTVTISYAGTPGQFIAGGVLVGATGYLSAQVDTTYTDNGSTTTPSSGTIARAFNDAVMIGFCLRDGVDADFTFDSTWQGLHETTAGGSVVGAFAYKTVTSTATEAFTGTWATSSGCTSVLGVFYLASDQSVAIGQATETNTAQSMTVQSDQSIAIGQASETSTAQAMSSDVSISIGQAEETTTAMSMRRDGGVVDRSEDYGFHSKADFDLHKSRAKMPGVSRASFI